MPVSARAMCRENGRISDFGNRTCTVFTMEDDFTAAEIRKEDGKTGELLYEDSLAKLVLYQVPEGEEDKPLADLMGEDNKLLDFERAGLKEWMEIWATGKKQTLPA